MGPFSTGDDQDINKTGNTAKCLIMSRNFYDVKYLVHFFEATIDLTLFSISNNIMIYGYIKTIVFIILINVWNYLSSEQNEIL
jgi:hypothetical protein